MPHTPPSEFFLSYFSNTNFLGVILAILFGAVWLACYRPPLLQRLWLWEILAGSAIITLIAVSFIQIPIQNAVGKDITEILGSYNKLRTILLNGIPLAITAGVVQEGAKLLPPVIYWLLQKRTVDTKLMLIVGAIAGAGFGIFEAQWIHNLYFSAGWNWSMVQEQGLVTLVPFIERFIMIAFHTGACAVICYGLAKGFGWLYFIIVALIHAIIEYGTYLIMAGAVSFAAVEIYIGILAILIMAVSLWLRWKKKEDVEMHIKKSRV